MDIDITYAGTIDEIDDLTKSQTIMFNTLYGVVTLCKLNSVI